MRPGRSKNSRTQCAAIDRFIEEHRLPTTEPLRLEDPAEVRRVIALLADHGNVSTFDGHRPVYYLKPDQALRAAYYRNVVVHHFVPRGIIELALAMVGPGAVGKIEEDLWKARGSESGTFSNSSSSSLRRIAFGSRSERPRPIASRDGPG